MEKRPFIPAIDTVRAELVFHQSAQIVENVFHFVHKNGVPLPIDMLDLAAQLRTWWVTNLKQHVGSGVNLFMIRVTDMSEQFAPGVEFPISPAETGNGQGYIAPGNVTIAVKWTTGLRGRSFRGRTYHVGLTTDMFRENAMLPNFLDPLRTAYSSLLTVANTNWQYVVVSNAQNKQWRSQAECVPIIGVQIEGNLDSQRRRLNTRGQ